MFLITPSVALAYIDPGTTNVIFTSLGPIVAALLGVLGIFFRPICNFLKWLLSLIKKYKYVSIVLILLVAITGGFLSYRFLYKSTERTVFRGEEMYSKVLFIGIDGLDYRLTKKMMDSGMLPNLSALSQSGTFLKLISSNPPQSPVAWTSLSTGVNPGKHNIFDFIVRDPKNYIPELSISKSKKGLSGTDFENLRKSPAFWEIVTDKGISSEIFRWVAEFPPLQSKANVFPGFGVPDIKGTLGRHTYYTTRTSFSTKEEKENCLVVQRKDNIIRTVLQGPAKGKNSFLELPVEINIDQESKHISIVIDQKHEVSLKLGEWSDWVPITFKLGLMKKINGIVKFYLNELEPEFGLYMSPINLDPSKPAFRFTNPSELSQKLYDSVGYFATIGMPEDTKALEKGHISEDAFYELVDAIDAERIKMFWDFFERFKDKERAVYAYVFDASDRLQHMLWEDIDLENLRVPDKLKAYLAKIDVLIGDIVSQLPEDTLLLVSSDHGFWTFERSFSVNTWLSKNGFMGLTQSPSEDNYGEIFGFVDWDKTKAYSVGFSGIYLNLKGRESKGIVDKSSAEDLRKAIIEGLEGYRDPETGASVINKVYRKEEIYKGKYLENAPDLVVGFMPGYRISWQSAIGGLTPDVVFPNDKKWKADHIIDPEFVPGVFFTNQKTVVDQANITDIAPTIIKAIGLEVPDYMDGRSLL
jgi:predicted AlkP superfamily phosphohydrolase/phosphomutase